LTGKGRKLYFLAKAEIVYDAAGNPVRMEGISQDITEQKKAEEALKFKDYLLQNVNDAIISTDMQLNITSWNKAAETIYGYAAQEVLGQRLHHLLDFQPPALDSEAHQAFLAKGFYKGNITMRKKNGSPVVIEAHTIVLKDDKGDYIGIVSVDRDITQLSHMQSKVDESESILQLVIDTVPQAIFWKDIHSVYRGCNENFIRMFQLSDTAELIDKKDQQMYWGDGRSVEKLSKQDQRIIQGRIPKLFYTRLIQTKSGSSLWVDVRLVPLSNKDRQIVGVLGTVDDISERKLIEQALVRSNANLEAIIENTDDLIWAMDKDYTIIAMNSSLARFWHTYFHSVLQVGDSCFELQPFWMRQKWLLAHKKVLSGQKASFTKKFKLNNSYFWFDIACYPIVEASGHINGVSYIVRDVTERKKQEKILVKFVKRHSLLKLEQEKIKMISVLKGQEEERRLISMELHDGVGQMLIALNFKMSKLSSKLLSEIPAHVSILIHEIEKMQKNVYQEVRRISENLMPQFLNDFPLEQALEQLLTQTFGGSGILVESEILLPGHRLEKSIEIALFRMTQEIFSNILKHSRATQVFIRIKIKKDTLYLLVKDNGVGFNMSDGSHQKGKGLNNIRQRVSLLNGSFDVASHSGEGFHLQIKIPVSPDEKN
jgi:PAS domain S-box-containing protein